MFIYNLNEKGLKKFEKDINERIQEADYITITLETIESKLSIDITKEEIKEANLKVNVNYNENGYSYIDWNVLNGDAESNDRTVEQLVNRLKGTVSDLAGNDDVLVILMHDTNAKKTTAQSLQQIIDYLKSLGYEFRTLK